MKKKNAKITRQDLWDFIQEHKNKEKDEFGGWLINQEINRTDKQIMAIDNWNETIEKIEDIKGREE